MPDHSPQAPSPEHLAELLPQYGIDSFIAQGGMGAVYKGRQLSLDREVAIKVLLYEFGEDITFIESFTTEAKAMARLDHSNLLRVFDYGNIDGMPYIVMEYVDGGSLHEAAWNKTIEPIQAATIINSICEGLAHAHGHGIVHRDIKPANILLTLKAVPKVADFGLAHATDSDQPGLVMGTPGYTAPEVFLDPGQAGELADIYSVGVILHQLLTGIDPAGAQGPPTHPTGNLQLDAIWRKAAHINPAQRYATIEAMSSDLEKWSTAKQKATVFANVAPVQPAKLPVQVTTGSSGGILVKLVIIGILVGAIVFTYQLMGEKEQEIKRSIAEANETQRGGSHAPISDIQPGTDQPVLVEPTPRPDSTPTEIVVREEPVIQPVVVSEPDTDLSPGDPELRTHAISLIFKARKKRDKDLIRLPSSREAKVERGYLSALTVIRDAYVKRLEKSSAETTDAQLKTRLLAQAERAKDLDGWIKLLSPEPKRVSRKRNDTFSSSNISDSDGFVGNWDKSSEGKVTRWIGHSDGRMEIVGKDWKVSWKILENGTLEIDSGKIRPGVYTRDGNGWTGQGPFGQDTILNPGDW